MIETVIVILLIIGGALLGHLLTAIMYERRYGWLLERERDYQARVRRMGRATEEEEAP